MFADARRAIGLLTIFPAGKGAEGGLMPGRAMAFCWQRAVVIRAENQRVGR